MSHGRHLHVVLALLGLLCAARALAQVQEAPLQPGRPADSRRPLPPPLPALQARLDLLAAQDSSECDANYGANKTQAWINFGRYAAAEQLPRAVQSAAAANAEAVLQGLTDHSGPVLATPQLPHSRHVRDDLWRGIDAVKHDGRRCAAPKMTAFCEVQLAWVDFEAGAGGWQHVDPYVRIAEDYCLTAMRATPLETRADPGTDASAVPSAPPEPAAVSEEPAVAPRSLTVLFPHDRSRRADIRRPGHEQLRRLAAELRALPPGTRVLLVGNADLTGHDGYNVRLSTRRAQSVARELEALGVAKSSISIAARGSSEPVVQCPARNDAGERRRYLRCLEPNRRVVIELTTD
jgi:outer membrane protein OmpA-like peptidoglycan-associated protein